MLCVAYVVSVLRLRCVAFVLRVACCVVVRVLCGVFCVLYLSGYTFFRRLAR